MLFHGVLYVHYLPPDLSQQEGSLPAPFHVPPSWPAGKEQHRLKEAIISMDRDPEALSL